MVDPNPQPSDQSEHRPKRVKTSPMFRIHECISQLISQGLQDGLRLAQQIVSTPKFAQLLIEMLDCDIDHEKLGAFFRDNTFAILPISRRGLFDSSTCVDQVRPYSIYINPLLLLQLQFSEQQELCQRRTPSRTIAETRDSLTSQTQRNSFFVAVRVCHEITYLAHSVCGRGTRTCRQQHPIPTTGIRKRGETDETPIQGTATDLGDAIEKKLFGNLIRPYHPTDSFGTQELLVIEHPKASVGNRIMLTSQNFEIDEQLINLRVDFVSALLPVGDSPLPMTHLKNDEADGSKHDEERSRQDHFD
jgi:hypothetical protein